MLIKFIKFFLFSTLTIYAMESPEVKSAADQLVIYAGNTRRAGVVTGDIEGYKIKLGPEAEKILKERNSKVLKSDSREKFELLTKDQLIKKLKKCINRINLTGKFDLEFPDREADSDDILEVSELFERLSRFPESTLEMRGIAIEYFGMKIIRRKRETYLLDYLFSPGFLSEESLKKILEFAIGDTKYVYNFDAPVLERIVQLSLEHEVIDSEKLKTLMHNWDLKLKHGYQEKSKGPYEDLLRRLSFITDKV